MATAGRPSKAAAAAQPVAESSGAKKATRNSRRRRQQAEEAQQMSFEFYLSEGNTYRNAGELLRAITGYSKALDIRPTHKGALLSRSQCYLQVGDCKAAIADANATLNDDPKYYRVCAGNQVLRQELFPLGQGLQQKADINYQMGEFELALVLYHRGHKLRPDVEAFRLGIQLCQEAIENSIGEVANVKLEKKGDLSFFTELQQAKNQDAARTVSYADTTKQPSTANKRSRTAADEKTLKKLLEQLYDDKVFLEGLVAESEKVNKDSSTSEEVVQLGSNCLSYLDQRATFWQQKQPTYARRKTQKTVPPVFDPRDVKRWMLENLQQIDSHFTSKDYKKCLTQCNNVLKRLETCTKDELKQLSEYEGQLHGYIGNCYYEMKNWDKALEYHQKDYKLSAKCKSTDSKTRSMDNIARVQIKRKQYADAEKILKERLEWSKDALERAWIWHEIGRCQLEMKKYKKSRDSGELALKASTDGNDDLWKLNSLILIAQSYYGMKQYPAALENYQQARELAESIGDRGAVETMEFCIDELEKKLQKGNKSPADGSRRSSASTRSEAEKPSERPQSDTEEFPSRPDEIDSQVQSTPAPAEDEKKSSTEAKKSTAEKAPVKKELTVYSIVVKISDVENAGTDADLFVELIGDGGKSDRLRLSECANNSDKKLQRATETEFLVRSEDVGKLKSIRISHDSTIPKSGPHIASVRVRSNKNADDLVFPCHRWLDNASDDRETARELQVPMDKNRKEESISYHVTVRTVDEDDAGTDGKVYLEIYGDKGETEALYLDTKQSSSDTYDPGQTNEFDIEAADVGQIRAVRIQHDGESWQLDDVTIKADGRTYNFVGNVRLEKDESCELLAD